MSFPMVGASADNTFFVVVVLYEQAKHGEPGKGKGVLPVEATVDLVAKIFRLGLSLELISSNVSVVGVVDFTAKARRLGGDDGSSFGAINCGVGGGT